MNVLYRFRPSSHLVSPWLRLILPVALVLVWLCVGGIGGPYFGKIDQVSSNNLTDFLPASADATKVQSLSAKFRDASAIPAIIIVESPEKLQPTDLQQLQQLQQKIGQVSAIDGKVSPVIPSQDGKAAQIVALINTESEVKNIVEELRSDLHGAIPDSLNRYVAGPAGYTADLTEAFSGIDGLLLIVALIVVLTILLVVYKSPLLPIIVLLTSVFALSASILVVWWLAKWGVLQLNGQVQGILFILVIGAATDYSLLYVSRFKEALRHQRSPLSATLTAIKGSFEPILASGGTVIAGLLCLLLSELNSNKFLGPVSAIGIVFAMLSALSFLPSLLLLTGRWAFWPFKPLFNQQAPEASAVTSGPWAILARHIDQHPRLWWSVITAVLVAASLGLTQLKAEGIRQSDIIVGKSESRQGQEALARHFPGGSGNPVLIVAQADRIEAVVGQIEVTDGITSVEAVSDNSPSGTMPLGQNRPRFGPLAAATPKVVDGRSLLQATLESQSDSPQAEAVVRELRRLLPSVDQSVLVGGTTATTIDTKAASINDRNIIIPLVLLVITLILMLLLRSIIAPLLLIATTVLSFAATLGVAAFVFNDVFKMPGADPSVPLYAFIFLVALGIDYNIFLMTRVREEAMSHGTRQGVIRGVIVTGGVITSAGIVLAATFAALGVIPILFLIQLAFLVAFGVLLDTFIIRSMLVPALIRDIGSFVWWPSRLKNQA